jgi:DNA-binding XRE family transcriptional regulator
VEHGEAEFREVAPYDTPRDNSARFLRELRQLRDTAGLGQTELAVRAHYPRDAIRAAEEGPALPDLPVLSAYVRGCGGAVTEWEERWRALTSSPALPLLPSRTAGGSDAATAGARVGSVSLAADGHDPSLVMAALSRVAHGIAAEPQPAPLSVPAMPPSPAAPAAPVPPVPMPATGADGVAAEPGSLFAAAGAATPVTGAPEADWATSASGAGWAASTADAVWGAVPDAGRGAPAPDAATSVAPDAGPSGAGPRGAAAPTPASALGRPVGNQHTLPSRQLIAAVVILLCVAAVLLVLFA